MRSRIAALILIIVPTTPSYATGPSSAEEWQQMYVACVQGSASIAQKMNLGSEFPKRFCACVRDHLQNTPESIRNSKFDAVQAQCIGETKLSLSQNSSTWPLEGINTITKICREQPRKDVPAKYQGQYCVCFVEFMQKNVKWKDWLLLDLALQTKGLQNIDAQEKAIMAQVLDNTAYCSTKIVP